MYRKLCYPKRVYYDVRRTLGRWGFNANKPVYHMILIASELLM